MQYDFFQLCQVSRKYCKSLGEMVNSYEVTLKMHRHSLVNIKYNGSYQSIWISGVEELGFGNKRVEALFQQMSPTFFANGKFADDSPLSKAYNTYKRKYVKHLYFNPEDENSSKILTRIV